MHIRVLLLCSRNDARNILDCFARQSKITVEYCQDIVEFLLKITDSPYNLVITNELKESIIRSNGKDSEVEQHLNDSKLSTRHADTPTTSIPIQDYPKTFRVARHQFEKEYLTFALAEQGGNISQTAATIGITRRTLQLKIKKLHIDIERIRQEHPPG